LAEDILNIIADVNESITTADTDAMSDMDSWYDAHESISDSTGSQDSDGQHTEEDSAWEESRCERGCYRRHAAYSTPPVEQSSTNTSETNLPDLAIAINAHPTRPNALEVVTVQKREKALVAMQTEQGTSSSVLFDERFACLKVEDMRRVAYVQRGDELVPVISCDPSLPKRLST